MIDKETTVCPFCKSDDSKFLFRSADTFYCLDDTFFPVVKCRICKTCYLRVRPTMDSLGEYFYPARFYDLNKKQTVSPGLAARFSWVSDLPPGRLLDLGCAGAEFVNYAAGQGWQAVGYDWFAEDKNPQPNVIYRTPLLEAFAEHSFDVITMWAVLEHLYDPLAILQQAHKLLKPHGRLLILVPNFASISARLMRLEDIPRHTTFFTRKTLTEFLGKSKFKPAVWSFDDNIFQNSHRGCLLYLYKLLRGESMEQILAQSRTSAGRYKFYNTIKGRQSFIAQHLSRLDGKLTPYLDKLACMLKINATMTVSAHAMAAPGPPYK